MHLLLDSESNFKTFLFDSTFRFDFNDSSANPTYPPAEPYESSDPYILVYRRRKLDSNGKPIEPSAVSECRFQKFKFLLNCNIFSSS